MKLIKFSILAFSLIFILSGASLKESKLEIEEKDVIKEPYIAYFLLNKSKTISQKGEIFIPNNISFKNLVNLSSQNKSVLDLLGYFYLIQQTLIKRDLHISAMDYKNFGQIKIKTSTNEILNFQDFNIKNQLKTLDSFFSSQKMNSLLKDFKSIDLRYENRIAIGYM